MAVGGQFDQVGACRGGYAADVGDITAIDASAGHRYDTDGYRCGRLDHDSSADTVGTHAIGDLLDTHRAGDGYRTRRRLIAIIGSHGNLAGTDLQCGNDTIRRQQ